MEKILDELRKEINAIDEQFLRLLDQRLDIVKEIGVIKKARNIPIFNPEREKEILSIIAEKSNYPQHTKEIFQKIMDESKKLQQKP